MTPLEAELRELIVDVINLEDVTPEDIGAEEDLFSDDGLALDSIDALEIGVAIQKRYGVKLDTNDEKLPEHFKNLKALAHLVETRREVKS
ncbi:phosphopantetheine-binding protein [Henriciella sp.]|uniref:phosphopantetheine-binding protein n=1 Tax=Henriciella sp. TaxID=1968823 RepID=UPI00262D0B01|nr:phosphopantetheine-binding protein [Henriciella sp.]